LRHRIFPAGKQLQFNRLVVAVSVTILNSPGPRYCLVMARYPIRRTRQPGYLDGHFLVAMPAMEDERFRKTVIYLCAHSDEGAMGIVVNRPLQSLTFRDLLVQLKIIPGDQGIVLPPAAQAVPLIQGGPVESGRGFVLHSPDFHSTDSTLAIDGDICLTATLDVLRAIAIGEGPARAIMALGYAGWAPGQLEGEIRANGWLTCPGDGSTVFDADMDGKYDRLMRKIGITPASLSSIAGSA
jgi:putative transcriptional regulator